MNDFEDRLREALQRTEPPPGFAERVIARVPRRAARSWFRYAVAIAAALIVTCSAVLYEQHRREERRQAEIATRQVLFALRFTAAKIERVNRRVSKSTHVVNIDPGELKGRT